MQDNNRPEFGGDELEDDFIEVEMLDDLEVEIVDDLDEDELNVPWSDGDDVVIIEGDITNFGSDLVTYDEQESTQIANTEKLILLEEQSKETRETREIQKSEITELSQTITKTLETTQLLNEGLLTTKLLDVTRELPSVDSSSLLNCFLNEFTADQAVEYQGFTNTAMEPAFREIYSRYMEIFNDNTLKLNQDTEYKRNVSKLYVNKYLIGMEELRNTLGGLNSSTDTYLVSSFVRGEKFLGFSCSSCDNHISKLSDSIAVIVVLSDKMVCILPDQICDKCGSRHSYSKKKYKSIQNLVLSLFNAKINKLSNLSRQRSVSYVPDNEVILANIGKYVPVRVLESDILVQEFTLDDGVDDFELDDLSSELPGSVLEGEVEEEVVEEESYFDWDEEVANFHELVDRLYDTNKKLNNSLGVHNTAVVLANQYSVYEIVKKNAVASLIKVLEKDMSLARISLPVIKRLEVYKKLDLETLQYKENIQYINDIFDSNIVKADGSYDLEELKESVELYKSDDDLIDEVVSSIREMEYILSYLPVTTIALTNHMINSYFYDQRIIDVISHVADLMIINSYAENVFHDASPTKIIERAKKNNTDKHRYVGKVVERQDFVGIKKRFLGTKPYDFIKYRESYCYAFQTDISSHFLTMFGKDKDLYHKSYKFVHAARVGDIYEMSKVANQIKALISPVADNYALDRLYNAIQECPIIHHSSNKFEFYFKQFPESIRDLTEIQKTKFLTILESKGKLPKEYVGTTSEEIYENYINSDNTVSLYESYNDNIKDYFSKYSDILTLGVYLDATEFRKDYLPYLITRDALYTGCNEIGMLHSILNLSDIAIVSLLEDDWEPTLTYNPHLNYSLFAVPSLNFIDDPTMDDPESELKNLSERYSFLANNRDRAEEILNSLGLIE